VVTILALGFLIGMQHALEADHIAAVSSIVARETRPGGVLRHGLAWGLGHCTALLLVAGAAILLEAAVGEDLARALEVCVGIMLVLLGGHVIYRLLRDRIHVHLHRHRDGTVHVHAHSHRDETRRHDPERHEHAHPRAWPLRSLLVGLMHGMAGSAALLILAASAMPVPVLGLAYVALFGLGSVIGMGALSAVIAMPLAYSARFLTWANRSLQAMIGLGTLGLGAFTVYDSWFERLLFG
jgi:ABC-type nickel/cobalt efflux system permease component RcnA